MAIPIRISGITSNSLFMIEQNVAQDDAPPEAARIAQQPAQGGERGLGGGCHLRMIQAGASLPVFELSIAVLGLGVLRPGQKRHGARELAFKWIWTVSGWYVARQTGSSAHESCAARPASLFDVRLSNIGNAGLSLARLPVHPHAGRDPRDKSQAFIETEAGRRRTQEEPPRALGTSLGDDGG